MFSCSVFQVRNSLIAKQMASFQIILGVNMRREHSEKPVVNFKPDIEGVTLDLSFANPKLELVQPGWQDESYVENFPLGYLLEVVDNKLMKTLADYLILFFCKIFLFNIIFRAFSSEIAESYPCATFAPSWYWARISLKS